MVKEGKGNGDQRRERWRWGWRWEGNKGIRQRHTQKTRSVDVVEYVIHVCVSFCGGGGGGWRWLVSETVGSPVVCGWLPLSRCLWRAVFLESFFPTTLTPGAASERRNNEKCGVNPAHKTGGQPWKSLVAATSPSIYFFFLSLSRPLPPAAD